VECETKLVNLAPHPTSPLKGEEKEQKNVASFSPEGERIQE